MSVIYILLPVASLLAAGGVAAFIWAVRRGQFDDLDTPAVRMLHDDEDEDSDLRRDDERPCSSWRAPNSRMPKRCSLGTDSGREFGTYRNCGQFVVSWDGTFRLENDDSLLAYRSQHESANHSDFSRLLSHGPGRRHGADVGRGQGPLPSEQCDGDLAAVLRVHRLCRLQCAGRLLAGRIGKKNLLLLGLGLNTLAVLVASFPLPALRNPAGLHLLAGRSAPLFCKSPGNPVMRDVSAAGNYSRNLSFAQGFKGIGSTVSTFLVIAVTAVARAC